MAYVSMCVHDEDAKTSSIGAVPGLSQMFSDNCLGTPPPPPPPRALALEHCGSVPAEGMPPFSHVNVQNAVKSMQNQLSRR